MVAEPEPPKRARNEPVNLISGRGTDYSHAEWCMKTVRYRLVLLPVTKLVEGDPQAGVSAFITISRFSISGKKQHRPKGRLHDRDHSTMARLASQKLAVGQDWNLRHMSLFSDCRRLFRGSAVN